MTTTELIESYCNSYQTKKQKDFYLIVSEEVMNEFKKENNLMHVKGKIYFQGMQMKVLKKFKLC